MLPPRFFCPVARFVIRVDVFQHGQPRIVSFVAKLDQVLSDRSMASDLAGDARQGGSASYRFCLEQSA